MRGISRKFAIWFSVLTLLVLVFGLVVPDFVIFMSNTRKVEKDWQTLHPHTEYSVKNKRSTWRF